VIKAGNITEIYEYEKPFLPRPIKPLSKLQKKRAAARREARKKANLPRTKRAANRCYTNFFRLVHHNNSVAHTIHFITLTLASDYDYKTASRFLAHFFERVKKAQNKIPLDYISVPEFTKKGRIHFHLLVYDLSPCWFNERETRNLQRFWGRGYLDLRPAVQKGAALAGYLAKYMAKSLNHSNSPSWRGYSCSQTIKRLFTYSGNEISDYFYLDLQDSDLHYIAQYDTLWLGRGVYKKFVS